MGWTNEKVEELGKLWEKGLTANEIAKVLGVTKNAVVGKVHRLCLKARPSPIKSKGDEEDNGQTEINEEICETAEEISVEETAEKEDVVKETPDVSGVKGKIKLVELDSHTCRWPIGDPREEDFGFCGKKVRAGQTYCDEHSALAYVKTTRK